MIFLSNGRLVLESGVWDHGGVLFSHKIEKIVLEPEFKPPSGVRVIDVKGRYISPGFIDIHIHGAGGSDTMEGSIEALETISQTLIKSGTTSFLPTTVAHQTPVIEQALGAIREASTRILGGAQVLGAHLEGPFLSSQQAGAHHKSYLVPPTPNAFEAYYDIIRIITLAPEIKGALPFMDNVKEKADIVISLGHSNASYKTVCEAVDRGMSHAAHLFNGLPSLHHRCPGPMGAVLGLDMTCEIIADNVHVHPALYGLVLKLKGFDDLVLISDAMAAQGMPDGIYSLGEQQVTVAGGCATLATGKLAGSTMGLNEAVKNFALATQTPLHQVVNMASLNPARVVGCEKHKGSITKGKDADIVVFDDNYIIHKGFVQGKLKYDI